MCKFIAPITKKRVESNPQLDGKCFCLLKFKNTAADFEKNYDLILCEHYPDKIANCPKKIY